MNIEEKINGKNQKRDIGNNIVLTMIGLTGMYIFGDRIIYQTVKIASEMISSNIPLKEFYQNNIGMFLKASLNPLMFGLATINTYRGIYGKFYKTKNEENE